MSEHATPTEHAPADPARAAATTTTAPSTTGVGGAAARVLAVQRSAGNAATSAWLAGQRLTVQRLDTTPPGTELQPSVDRALTGFETDSAELTPDHQAAIAEIAADLNAKPLYGGFVTVTGSADRRGDAAHNKDLGQQRADAVVTALKAAVTDQETAGQIRAYSLGAPDEGPVADDPSLRKVDVTVRRREGGIHSPDPVPTPATLGPVTPGLPTVPGAPSLSPADVRDPDAPLGPRDPNAWQEPSWMWETFPPGPIPPGPLKELSDAIGGAFGRNRLARAGAAIASIVGAEKSKVAKDLNKAMVDGGEAGLTELLKKVLEMLLQKAQGPRPADPGATQGIPDKAPGQQTYDSPPVPF